MALVKCPKCDIMLKKGSWEIFTNCPNCNAEWPVAADEYERAHRKVVFSACLYPILSFVPIVGFIAGIMGIAWGCIAFKLKEKVLGITAIVISAIVGLGGQAYFSWWGYGQASDQYCKYRLEILADSIHAYYSLSGQYPSDLAAMKNLRMPIQTECFTGGGPYYYQPPASAKSATMPATQTLPNIPTSGLAATNQPTPSARAGNAETLIAAETFPDHRYDRMVITSDFEVRAIPHNDFNVLVNEPQNQAFAKGLNKSWRTATQAAEAKNKKPSASTGKAATATSAATATATASSTASSQPVKTAVGR